MCPLKFWVHCVCRIKQYTSNGPRLVAAICKGVSAAPQAFDLQPADKLDCLRFRKRLRQEKRPASPGSWVIGRSIIPMLCQASRKYIEELGWGLHLLVGAVILGLLLVQGLRGALLVQQPIQRDTCIVGTEHLHTSSSCTQWRVQSSPHNPLPV